MNYILFDNFRRNYLLPLSFTRPVADMRIGILTIREKWEKYLKVKTSTLTEDYLREKYPILKEKDNILINGSICPNKDITRLVMDLQPKQALTTGNSIIALHVDADDLEKVEEGDTHGINEIKTNLDYIKLDNTWDIFAGNDEALRNDFALITKNRKSEPLNSSNHYVNKENIFIEKGAKIENSILNASNGPIYIGKDAEIMEGCMIRGPVAICNNAVLKMGSKIYGATTIGPHSKVGGEVNNSVFFGYSNKAHDGFIGNSVIGEWCNLGAGTNNSNLRNTYDEVRLWCYPEKTFIRTGKIFCGLIMGDHTKCAINTTFNTGTVVGVNVNLYGSGFHRNFIPSFTWGGTGGFTQFDFNKAVEVAKVVYQRRNRVFDETEEHILKQVYNLTLQNKSF